MNLSHIAIRPLGEEDLAALQSLATQTYFETFQQDNTSENMALYIQNAFSLTRLQDELNNTLSKFYFAVIDENPVGYLKLNFSTAQTDLRDPSSLEIERIYVLEAYHGKKVGQALFNKALEVAHTHNLTYVWLGVWERNYKALAFYEKNGFVKFDEHIFMFGDDPQTDYLLRLNI